MGIDSKYGDREVKQSGRWFKVSGEDARLKIAHASNEAFQKYFREEMPRIDMPGPAGLVEVESNGAPDIDEEKYEEAFSLGIAEHLLLDWENLTLEDPEKAEALGVDAGETVPYSTENAVALFDLIPEFRRDVFQVALDESKFRKQQKEDDQKN